MKKILQELPELFITGVVMKGVYFWVALVALCGYSILSVLFGG